MSVTVVTTLHKDGYELYGVNNLNSWAHYFPSEWSIVYYAEKHTPQLSNRVRILNFDEVCSNWSDFYKQIQADVSKYNNDEKRINWYKKALRWSFKMFAVLHAIKNTNTRYLIWLDADVVATGYPPQQWINSCLSGQCLAAQLEFIKVGGHVETGILIIDLHHPDVDILYNWIKLGYIDKQILKEEKAWDGIWLAKLVQSDKISWNNLKMVIKKDTAQAFSDVQLKWLTHRVGKKKFADSGISARSGRTPDQELI